MGHKPPGNCPHASHPWNCPAVKCLQDAVDPSEAAWTRLIQSYNHFKGSGQHPPDVFRSIFDLAMELAENCISEIEDNRVEAR